MARGGKRTGAGRPKLDSTARSVVILDELLIPAFKAALQTEVIYVGISDLQDAYGNQGLVDWRTWFEEVELGHGITHGGVPTSWRLKLKLAVAAAKLLQSATSQDMPWPSEQLRIVKNKRAYDQFWAQHKKYATEISKQFGTSVRDPEPFDPAKDYTKHLPLKDQDQGPRSPMTDATKGYTELLDLPTNVNYGFTGAGTMPDNLKEEDVPY